MTSRWEKTTDETNGNLEVCEGRRDWTETMLQKSSSICT
jgi:hypothetical protein